MLLTRANDVVGADLGGDWGEDDEGDGCWP